VFQRAALLLASAVFVKKPERIMALRFIMVLCLLVSRLAEVRVRSRLVETQQTLPDQVQKPTERPTMRWVFHCFDGIELLHSQTTTISRILVLGLQPLHRLMLHV
jgi:transposase